jgi:C-terminal peptidase prc
MHSIAPRESSNPIGQPPTLNAMIIRVLTLALASPLLFAAPFNPPIQDTGSGSGQASAQEIDAILDVRLSETQALSVEQIWGAARKLAIEVGDEYGEAFDSALDARLTKAGSWDPSDRTQGQGKQVLFLAAARVYGEDPDADLLQAVLLPLLQTSEQDLVLGALSLVPLIGINSMEEDPRADLTNNLLQFAENETLPAPLRVRAAMTAHKVALGRQVPRAQRILSDFLAASDPGLRAEGALALAQLGVLKEAPGVQSELEALANNPGPRGQLAEALLKQERLRTYYDSKLRRAREERSDMVDNGRIGKDIKALEDLIAFVQAVHLEGSQFTREDLMAAAYRGMLGNLDRHSSYFASKSFKRFEQDLDAEYGGIGAYVGIDREDSLFTITRPLYSGPAYKAGLQTDDKIIRIGDWPTISEKMDDVIKRLKGRPGTKVKLYVWRRGMDAGLIERPTEDMVIEVERGIITIPPVHYEMLPDKVGLVELTTFSKVASAQLVEAIMILQEQGAKSFILDLRNNSGGLLNEARNVADIFLPKGKLVVSTAGKGKGRQWKTRNPELIPADVPVTVLINRFSASASEIVAGALQDHGRSTLVGQRSYGKGSVQNLFLLPGYQDDTFVDENNNRRFDTWEKLAIDHNGNGEFDFAPHIKLTIERYMLPTGRSIHRELDDEGNITSPGGIEPDVNVDQIRRNSWEIVEMRRIQGTGKLREYVQSTYPGKETLFDKLAETDADDYSLYPGFDELFDGLGTVLTKQDVRFLLRMEVRRKVQDARGSAFPLGDFQSDLQLQKAIAENFKALGATFDSEGSYAQTFDEPSEPGAPPALLARAEDLRKALDLVKGSSEAGLNEQQLKTLRDLLESASGQN